MTETQTTARPPALDLSDALALDKPAAAALADSLRAAGLIHDLERGAMGGVVELTAAGAALQDRLRRLAGRLSAELVAPFDASDIETTIRTLQEITTRASRPASTTTEEHS